MGEQQDKHEARLKLNAVPRSATRSFSEEGRPRCATKNDSSAVQARAGGRAASGHTTWARENEQDCAASPGRDYDRQTGVVGVSDRGNYPP